MHAKSSRLLCPSIALCVQSSVVSQFQPLFPVIIVTAAAATSAAVGAASAAPCVILSPLPMLVLVRVVGYLELPLRGSVTPMEG